MTTDTKQAMQMALDALKSPVSRGPTWALIERYADAVCEYNTALRIDVGVDKAGAECLRVEKELRAHLAALREAIERDGWRPISEAPTDGTQVLATWAHTWTRNAPHIEVCETGEKGDWFYSYDGDSPAKPPTHWRPLPDAPKD